MAREGGIEKISTFKKKKKSSKFLSLLYTGLGLSLLFAEGLELDEKTHWQIHRHAPRSACVSLLCVCLCMFGYMFASLFVCMCALRHTLLQPCNLRISLQEWVPTHIRNTVSFVPFKQVADCFNKKKCESALNKDLASRYCNIETAQNTVSALPKQTA